MSARRIWLIEGFAWMALTLVWGVLLIAHLINDTDWHQASIAGLLTCILAKMAFREARDAIR